MRNDAYTLADCQAVCRFVSVLPLCASGQPKRSQNDRYAVEKVRAGKAALSCNAFYSRGRSPWGADSCSRKASVKVSKFSDGPLTANGWSSEGDPTSAPCLTILPLALIEAHLFSCRQIIHKLERQTKTDINYWKSKFQRNRGVFRLGENAQY